MHDHFSKLSASYNYVRTTDHEPVLYIKEKLSGKDRIRGADIGCGGGRYDLLLLEALPGLHLLCGDINEPMVKETICYLEDHGQKNFFARLIDSSGLQLPDNSLDFILTFNAIHHFDPVHFLSQAARAIQNGGYIFVYTRLRSQNVRSIWGRFFPGFREKEGRLYDLPQIDQWSGRVEFLYLEEIRFFQFKRIASLQHLLNQAENRHYSTFCLYSEDECNLALSGFKEEIERHFEDVDRVGWTDENAMIVFRKGTGTALMNSND